MTLDEINNSHRWVSSMIEAQEFEITVGTEDYLELLALAKWVKEHERSIMDGLDAGDRFYYGAKKFTEAKAAFPSQEKK